MFTRISTDFLQTSTQEYVRLQQSRLRQLQEKMANGANISRFSDDPLKSTQLQELKEAAADQEQYKQNVSQMLTELNTADTSVNDLVQVIQRARELTIQASNDTLGQSNLDAIAVEVDQLINQVIFAGNTQVGQRYLFSGFGGNIAPFNRTGNNVTFNGTPSTSIPGYERFGELATGVTLSLNTDISGIVGSVTTNAGPPETVTSGSGLVRSLTELKLALQQGDKTTVRNQISSLTNNLNETTAVQSTIGARVNQLDTIQSRLDERSAIIQQELAGIQDIDLAKTISDLTYQQTIYQASLKVNADIMQTSLLDFLR